MSRRIADISRGGLLWRPGVGPTAPTLNDGPERLGKSRGVIMQEIAAVPPDPASFHGHASGHLLHPWLVGMDGDPGDVHPPALEMDEK
jgi:hypothetical protein